MIRSPASPVTLFLDLCGIDEIVTIFGAERVSIQIVGVPAKASLLILIVIPIGSFKKSVALVEGSVRQIFVFLR